MRRTWRARRRLPGQLALLLLAVAIGGFVLAMTLSSRSGVAQPGAPSLKTPGAVARHGYQLLAGLTASQEVFAAPGARPFRRISATRPITGEQTVLPVLHEAPDAGIEWLQVRLPGRPNGLMGWIQLSGTKLEYTPWRIVVNTARRRVYAYNAGRMVRSFSAVVGDPRTPTPKGQFFVEENVDEPGSSPFYPYALALSARSSFYQTFDNGPGQIAIHGLEHIGGTPGTAVSHGCVRLDTADITWLAKHTDPGMPITVY